MAIQKTKQKEKWSKILAAELISSEESGSDDGEQVLIVHALLWRYIEQSGPYVSQSRQNCTITAFSPREVPIEVSRAGSASTRPQTQVEDIPKWAISAIMY